MENLNYVELEQAKRAGQRALESLRDVSLPLDLRMEVGGFLSFADFFLDGLIADYLVQSRIGEAREQVEDAIYQVTQLLDHMNRL